MLNHAICYQRYGPPERVLALHTQSLPPLAAGKVRVQMRYAPLNPSDLIPVTGAYRHRTTLPAVAGYEGVGVVVAASPGSGVAPGQRVLPLRGEGTWQSYLDIAGQWLVPVPDEIDDRLAARGYINPLTALLMLRRWPVAGKNIVLTAASSSGASLLAQWALRMGARSVCGVIRSPQHRHGLELQGVYPLMTTDRDMLGQVLQQTDLLFDAVGGESSSEMLAMLPPSSTLISWGLHSGAPLRQSRYGARVSKFHLREALPPLDVGGWRAAFSDIWRLLPHTTLPAAQVLPFRRWREAIVASERQGSARKILLDFSEPGEA
ncbi:zinc-dependent alcohol dehydrogenase family protein [Klebsiella sp. WOUb02]|uniref:zinc-dependent alcohol dehydrogenase family protein n=1 Tax=Klebsiella sp. WOUb02 TaxID=3161071 RepID=UPI003CECE1FE